MTSCDTCGNEYDGGFSLTTASGDNFNFDSFECAIEKAAPRCQHCGCRILGHGIEGGSGFFCCAHCARQSGIDHAVDNPVRG